jgi:hypothetical protein
MGVGNKYSKIIKLKINNFLFGMTSSWFALRIMIRAKPACFRLCQNHEPLSKERHGMDFIPCIKVIYTPCYCLLLKRPPAPRSGPCKRLRALQSTSSTFYFPVFHGLFVVLRSEREHHDKEMTPLLLQDAVKCGEVYVRFRCNKYFCCQIPKNRRSATRKKVLWYIEERLVNYYENRSN